ncbi:MAG: zinc-ribbon domain-containing protein, partial [Lachnospiraceae bacterium]|nr:zinc-ribbon domain-containing protein [Lachnospiraceae bacterium]
MKVCRKCGTPMPDQMKYCERCGASLDGAIVRSSSGRNEIPENKALTIGMACGVSIALVILMLICIFAIENTSDYYLVSGRTDQPVQTDENKRDDENAVYSAAGLTFTANTYEVEANKDINMSNYLQCSGLELSDVNWISDSEKMYVGSNGHVSLHENGIACGLTAVSKSDDTVKAQCQLKTRTEAEDLTYQVEALNNVGHDKDEEVDDGVVRVAYDSEGSQMIDLSAMRYEPGERKDSYTWDKKLFYTLEDVDLGSDTDGKINSYFVEKKQFLNKESGNEMEYEIYHNPDTDVINKIVSIEYKKKKLVITEYYYTDDGEINFIYSYEDTNYTPSYATPNQDGERFRFCHDTLVTWRIVEDGQMTNYCYGSDEKKQLEQGYRGMVKLYADCSEEIQQAYDEKEQRMLNLAYNTMDKIRNEEGISTISGYVYDSSDYGIPDTNVQLVSEDYSCEIYATVTDDSGFYEIRIPTRDMIYSLTFEKSGHIEENICEVDADVDEIHLVQETVYLSP